MSFFKGLHGMLYDGQMFHCCIVRKGDKMTVSIMPDDNNIKDKKNIKLIPCAFTENPETLDNLFIPSIQEPMYKATTALNNLAAFNNSVKATEKVKPTSGSVHQKDAYTLRIEEINKHIENKKYTEAIDVCNKLTKKYPQKATEISQKKKEVEQILINIHKNNLFGGQDLFSGNNVSESESTPSISNQLYTNNQPENNKGVQQFNNFPADSGNNNGFIQQPSNFPDSSMGNNGYVQEGQPQQPMNNQPLANNQQGNNGFVQQPSNFPDSSMGNNGYVQEGQPQQPMNNQPFANNQQVNNGFVQQPSNFPDSSMGNNGYVQEGQPQQPMNNQPFANNQQVNNGFVQQSNNYPNNTGERNSFVQENPQQFINNQPSTTNQTGLNNPSNNVNQEPEDPNSFLSKLGSMGQYD